MVRRAVGASEGVTGKAGPGTPERGPDGLGQVERRVTSIVRGHDTLTVTSGHKFQIRLENL